MSFCTYYTVSNGKNKKFLNFIPEERYAACFASYLSVAKTFGENVLEVFIIKPKSNKFKNSFHLSNKFTEEQILEYINGLGGVFSFQVSETKEYYIISLKESDYINKIHVRIFLDYIRCLWESIGPLEVFFEIDPKIREKICSFVLVQICSLVGKRKGHGVPSCSYFPEKFKVFSKYDLEKNLKNMAENIFSTNSFYAYYSDKKFNEYQKYVPTAKKRIDPEKLSELRLVIFDKEKIFTKALKIVNPIPLELIKK